MKGKHVMPQVREIPPQENLHLFLPNEAFPQQDVYSVLGSFGGLDVDRETCKAWSAPRYEETYRMTLVPPNGTGRYYADGSLSRIQEQYRWDCAPEARWDVGLAAFRDWESLFLTHAIACRALLLLKDCVLFRGGDDRIFRDPEDWYRTIEPWFRSEPFVTLGLATEEGRLLI